MWEHQSKTMVRENLYGLFCLIFHEMKYILQKGG
nr:MAG TPA: hypothetical protein [Caudoviricetes sp.]